MIHLFEAGRTRIVRKRLKANYLKLKYLHHKNPEFFYIRFTQSTFAIPELIFLDFSHSIKVLSLLNDSQVCVQCT